MPVVELPRLRTMARHALPMLVEATLIPLALFYLGLWLLGLGGAMVAALLWSWGALVRRALTGRRLPGTLMIGALGLTVRTGMGLASGSAVVYFLQPTLTTVLVGAAFLLSVPAGRPLAERLAGDFCPLPDSLLGREPIRRLFGRISVLWAFVHLANAGLTVWLLMSQPLSTYLVLKTVVGWTISGCAVALSVLWFTREVRRHGLAVARV